MKKRKFKNVATPQPTVDPGKYTALQEKCTELQIHLQSILNSKSYRLISYLDSNLRKSPLIHNMLEHLLDLFFEISGENKKIEEAKNIISTTKKIDGWLWDEEGKALYSIAKNGPGKGVIVEIGSFKGKSTIWLAKGSKLANREKIYSIDSHELNPGWAWGIYIPRNTYKVFKKNLKKAGVDDWVIPMVMKSEQAVKKWDKPIRLLWIDGSHKYEDVKRDFLYWESYVVTGGIIAIHDTVPRLPLLIEVTHTGPSRVIEKYVLKSEKFKIVNFVGTTTFIKKVRN